MALRETIRAQRRTITTKEPVHYFSGKVTEETIAEYCRSGSLPAHKIGRVWFIDTEVLMDWQMGRLKKVA